jgi:hypothetical protein
MLWAKFSGAQLVGFFGSLRTAKSRRELASSIDRRGTFRPVCRSDRVAAHCSQCLIAGGEAGQVGHSVDSTRDCGFRHWAE